MEDRADRVSDKQRSVRAKKRGRKVLSILTFAAVAAGIVGFTMGRSANQSAEEVVAAMSASNAPEGGIQEFLAGEGTRVIRNMWLSEIMEQQR